jgi:medium-chain acyl-[acyl-carrier-protein] hydrolase
VGTPISSEDVAKCSRPNPDSRLRLFCFPFAGGGAWAFNTWADQLPPDLRRETELWSVCLPGRESRRKEPLATRLSTLLEALTAPLTSLLTVPHAFFGHSMGALVSYEIACRLRSKGVAGPVHMIVSGHRAPQLPDRHVQVHKLPDQEILAKLRRLGGTPEEVLQEPELMEMYLPLLRADFAVCETYTYQHREPLNCSITALGGTEDAEVSREELSAWRIHTRGTFSSHIFPGSHFFLQNAQNPFLQLLAQDLRRVLRRMPQSTQASPHELPSGPRANRARA